MPLVAFVNFSFSRSSIKLHGRISVSIVQFDISFNCIFTFHQINVKFGIPLMHHIYFQNNYLCKELVLNDIFKLLATRTQGARINLNIHNIDKELAEMKIRFHAYC